jgi:hypothetical protein
MCLPSEPQVGRETNRSRLSRDLDRAGASRAISRQYLAQQAGHPAKNLAGVSLLLKVRLGEGLPGGAIHRQSWPPARDRRSC